MCIRDRPSLLQRRRLPEANQTLHDVWPSPGLVHYIDNFGISCLLTEFCQVQNSLSVHLRTIAQVSQAISSQLRHLSIDNRKKSVLNSNMSYRCPHNMVNFGPLAAEISPVFWGNPSKFQLVSRLGSVTARHVVVGASCVCRSISSILPGCCNVNAKC